MTNDTHNDEHEDAEMEEQNDEDAGLADDLLDEIDGGDDDDSLEGFGLVPESENDKEEEEKEEKDDDDLFEDDAEDVDFDRFDDVDEM